MAPEQAKGKPVDRRADIWAFGCVLYEMLTGARAFDGEDATEILGAIVKTEPDWSRLPRHDATASAALVRRCLQKDPRRRQQHIGDARIEIEEAAETPELPASPAGRRARPWPASVPWAIAAVAMAAALVDGFADLHERLAGGAGDAGRHHHAADREPRPGRGLRALAGRAVHRVRGRVAERAHLRAHAESGEVRPLPGTEGADAALLVARQPVGRLLRRRQPDARRAGRGAPATIARDVGPSSSWRHGIATARSCSDAGPAAA